MAGYAGAHEAIVSYGIGVNCYVIATLLPTALGSPTRFIRVPDLVVTGQLASTRIGRCGGPFVSVKFSKGINLLGLLVKPR